MTSMHRAVRARRVGNMKTAAGVRVIADAVLAEADAMRYQRTIGPARYAEMLAQVAELYAMARMIESGMIQNNDLTSCQVAN